MGPNYESKQQKTTVRDSVVRNENYGVEQSRLVSPAPLQTRPSSAESTRADHDSPRAASIQSVLPSRHLGKTEHRNNVFNINVPSSPAVINIHHRSRG